MRGVRGVIQLKIKETKERGDRSVPMTIPMPAAMPVSNATGPVPVPETMTTVPVTMVTITVANGMSDNMRRNVSAVMMARMCMSDTGKPQNDNYGKDVDCDAHLNNLQNDNLVDHVLKHRMPGLTAA